MTRSRFRFGRRALATVAQLSNLTRLHLDRTSVTDEGLAELQSLTQLEYLNLYGTKVTDAGVGHLAKLANLRQLYVWRTKVTPEGIARLQSQVPRLAVNDGIKEPAAVETAAAK